MDGEEGVEGGVRKKEERGRRVRKEGCERDRVMLCLAVVLVLLALLVVTGSNSDRSGITRSNSIQCFRM